MGEPGKLEWKGGGIPGGDGLDSSPEGRREALQGRGAWLTLWASWGHSLTSPGKMKRRDRILAATSMKELGPEPTPPHPRGSQDNP